MANPYISPLRRAESINPYTDAEQSLLDNAFASPISRSFQQAINTDVAGNYRQQALEAQLRGDGVAQRTAEYNRASALRRMELPTVGPTTFGEARTTGNYGDYVQNVLGSMAGSMVKPLVSASAGGLLGGPLGAAAGGFGGSYSAIRNAELEQYAGDNQLNTLSPKDQLRDTRNSALLQAVPEAIMPAYLGAGGRLPGALNRVPTALRVAGSVGAEGATEGLQDYISQKVAQNELPDRQVDWGRVQENVIAGLIGGGAMGVLGRHDTGRVPQEQDGPAAEAPMDAAVPPGTPPLPTPDGGTGPAYTMLGKVAGLGAAVQDRFGDDIAAAGGKAKDMAGKAKDIVSDTIDRMTEAVKTAENPGDFLNKVFGGSIDEEAAADVYGQPNPTLKGITFEETEANIDRDDEQRVARAARYADELLNDPATPDEIKQRVADMGGDYANPDNQSFVARTLIAQRGGEKITKAVLDLIDLGKSAFAKGSEAAGEGLSAAKKAVVDAATAAQDRIVKKNLQSVTPAERAAFGKVIFDGLTDEAKANPLVRAQLSDVTNAMMAFAAKTGDVTAKDLPTLTKLSNAMSLFKDPDAMAQTLVEYAGLPRTEDSFLSRIKRITNAQQDLKQPNSFLVSSLTPEARRQLTAPQLQRVAQLVDQFTLIDSTDSKKGTALVQGLANAFGSPESAKAVLDYYAQQNKANLRFDPNEGEDARPRSSDDISDADDIEGFGTLSEQDAKELVPRFRSPNINRPFFRGRDDAASAVELSRGGDLAQRVSMAEHVRASGDSARIVAGDIRRDLMKRLNDNVSRDTESVRGALRAIEAHLEDATSNGEWAGYSEAVALRNKLRGTKTEDRSAIVKALRDELKALDSAAEKAKRSGKDAGEAMLELYDVVLSSPDSSKASDAQMTKFRKLLDTTSEKKSKAENDAIRKTGVTFKIDGKKVAVSLESMVYNSPVRGSVRERLLESLGLVAARADEMPNIPNDAIVKRNYFGGGRHLTWGRLMGMGANPDVKFKARKKFGTDPAKEAIKAELDKVNASNLREYMNNLPKDVDALPAGAGLLSRIEGQIEVAKGHMEENPSKDVGDRIRSLSSKRRVLKAYLNEILDADYPVSREAIMDNLESELQAEGIVNKEGQKTEYANILFKEELIQTYRDRADAVKGTSLADDALAKADELAVELDKDLAKLQDFQRMDLMDRPSARSKGADSTAPKKALSNKEIQTELAAARARLERVQNADLESFRAAAANESDSFLVRQNLSQEKLAKAKEDAVTHAQDMVSRWEAHAANQKKPKVEPNPAASSRETAKKVDDAHALSPDALTALHDVAVKENWSRLDTPAKVLKFAAMAAKAREQLKKIPELERTDEQDDLRYKLNDMFDQSKGFAFDWESLWDGLDPTDAQKAQLDGIVRPKAEPGTARPASGEGRIRKNSFIGAKADPEGAKRAAEALKSEPADVVWNTLGWFRGPDGKLRKEIRSPVLKSRVLDLARKIVAGDGSKRSVLSLLDGVPGLDNYAGTWLKDTVIDPNGELTRAVQGVGVFIPPNHSASIGVPNTIELSRVAAELSMYVARYGREAISAVIEDAQDQGRSELSYDDVNDILRKVFPMDAAERDEAIASELASVLLHELQHAFQAVEGFENGGTPSSAVLAKYGDVDGYLKAVADGNEEAVKGIQAEAYFSLLCDIGPDVDPEAAALALYEDIVGEAEANDVQARMRLTDEEARAIKPALASTERKFVKSIIPQIALSMINEGLGPKPSTMKPKRGRPGKIDQQAILDEIARIRGKDVKVAFAKFADIGASGEFSMNKDKTERLIRVAINSLNPMSVAWHESLHDFMAMLGGDKAERKLKADLLDAAGAPQVMAKLRELLKDHPNALKQIETDREERLAYMYQFWAEGALPLGPTGTNIFSRMVTFFREMLGVLSQDQKIDQLFTALHTGKFAEPSLVGAVLEDLKAQTLSDKAREVSGPIGDAAEKMLTGATDRLRNTNVDALTELADLFHREPGRENSGELPFLQRRAQQVGKRLNKLQDILKDTTSEERRRALENMQAMKPASTPLEKELAAYLKELRDYMVDRGVKRFDTKTKKWTDLGNVKDYFPRVWDKEAIRNNEAEFVGLMEQYIGKAQARETFNALVNGDGSLELAENEHTLGFTPWNPSVLDRQFTFINPSNAAAFAKFQSKDMADTMTSYTQRAVHRAEYASTFGNDGEVITSKFLEAQKQGATQDELAMARKATMAMEGTLGYDFNPCLKEVMSGIVTYQNIVLLPLSLFSNLIDPLGVAIRSNDMKEAWKAFTYGMKGIADQLRGAGDDAQTEMAKTLGIIDEQNMLEAMGHVYNSMHMSRFLRNINSKFFRYNGMEMWNQRMRVAAMMAAQRFILANLGHERYQSELGITDADVFQLADGTIALTKDQLLQAGAKESEVSDIEKRIQAAVFKWVDGAVLRPNAAHRPIWGSDPRYQLIFHLKHFTFSFHNTILRRVGEELKHGNVAPGWILMSYVPFMFLSDVLKGSLTGTLNTTADLYDVASQSIARSGIMGTGVFGADAMGDLERGKLPGTSFLGPAFDHLMTLLSGITGHAGVDQVVNRSVPFAKYI